MQNIGLYTFIALAILYCSTGGGGGNDYTGVLLGYLLTP